MFMRLLPLCSPLGRTVAVRAQTAPLWDYESAADQLRPLKNLRSARRCAGAGRRANQWPSEFPLGEPPALFLRVPESQFGGLPIIWGMQIDCRTFLLWQKRAYYIT